MAITQTIKNVARATEIVGILIKYGFEEFVSHTPLSTLIPQKALLKRGRYKKLNQYSVWERIRMVAEDLGPTFIKLAQALSNRPDVLPQLLIDELQKLQSEVPQMEFDAVEEIIFQETGKKIDEVYKDFQVSPIGSASIGQVHRAVLRKNNLQVVVKVQRPGVQKKVTTDLSILKTIVKWTEVYLERQGVYNALEVIESFEKSLLKELDYKTEARFMNQFRNYYKRNKKFKVPKVYQTHSTSRLLTMEYVAGAKITDVTQLRAWGLSPEKIAERGMDIYLTQIFEHGYFHADPHPGNIIIQEDGVICLIDFGSVGKLNKNDRLSFAGILIGMAQQDVKKMSRSFKKLAIEYEIEDQRAFETDLEELIDDFSSIELGETNMAEIATRLQKIIGEYRIIMPGGVFIILRALTMLEGIGKEIHPEFKTYEFFKPYGFRLFKETYSPKNITEEIFTTLEQFLSFTTSFPTETREIIQKLRKGKLQIEIKNLGYEPVMDKLNHGINRLALSIVILGLYIASALVMFAYVFYKGPYDIWMLILSVIGFIFAIAFTSWLFIISLWSNR